ncbi:MAG: patatin-like phospholipase family protein [Verrucomicrobia bacterium]|nr:patatin-like phospholipase family protein [Verrucomicrobiota bacterium]
MSRRSLFSRALLGLIPGVALVSGCLHAPLNAPKDDAPTTASGYTFASRVPESVNRGETLFLVAFSGGGTRAAAMAYGVLEELRRTPVPGSAPERRMIEDINVISSVSGGSVTAAAYALYGDSLFDSFETNFLKRDVQGKLVGKVLMPWNWPRLASPWFGRSDLAARYYDEILFHNATFGDLTNRHRPFVMLNATEVATGIQFWFTQDVFNNLCSDLGSYPLSRAVAASSAVPVALSPVTLKNYAGTCGYEPPEWARADTLTGEGMALLQRGRELAILRNGAERPFLHLVDGGVTDNLGLRPLLEGLAYMAAVPSSRQGLRFESLRRVVLLSVNARSSPTNHWDRRESPPGMVSMALAAPSITMDRYSKDTVAMMGMMVELLQKKLPDAEKGSLQFFPITLSFDSLKEASERDYFLNVPTSFFLSNDAVDRLREVGGRLLKESPDFQRLLQDYAQPSGKRIP